jgi:predicted dehydrogenase
MKALVVGYGSIGSRHARLLNELGCRTAVVSSREIDFNKVYRSVSEALNSQDPEYIVIANKTNQHYDTLMELINLDYDGTVLVEKPLFSKFLGIPQNKFKDIFVGYNLRFHPVIQRLLALFKNKKILSVQAYVGQYLPYWRPQTDYRKTYSASVTEGGGVLRDLSHELEYLSWILGGWERLTALGGHYSHLEITSDDVFAVMLVTRKCPVVTVQLNYLDRETRRLILINMDDYTVEADFVSGTLTINKEVEKFNVERDQTYRTMHKAVLKGDYTFLCSIEEGMDVMGMIQAAEQSVKEKKWVSR